MQGMNYNYHSLCGTAWESSFTFCICLHFPQKTPGHLLATLPCWDTPHTSDRPAPSLVLTPRTGWCVGNTVTHLFELYRYYGYSASIPESHVFTMR